MPQFSERSLACYATLHFDLQRICEEAIKITDFSIICGHRDAAAQEKAFLTKVSKLRWPKSRHNSLPSQAMDLVPYPLDWQDTKSFHYLAGVIMATAHKLGIELVWGGTWAMRDLPHFELTRKSQD